MAAQVTNENDGNPFPIVAKCVNTKNKKRSKSHFIKLHVFWIIHFLTLKRANWNIFCDVNGNGAHDEGEQSQAVIGKKNCVGEVTTSSLWSLNCGDGNQASACGIQIADIKSYGLPFSGTLIFSPVRGLGSGPNFNLDLPGQPFLKPNNKYQSRKPVSSTDWMYKTSERKGLVSTRVRRKSMDMTIVTIQPGSTRQSGILIKTNFREVNGGSLVILIKMELRTKMSHFWLNGSKMGIFQKSL